MHAAKVWMIDNQLGRRNLSGGQRDFLMGERYRLEKAQGQRTDLTSGQNDQKSEWTEAKLAEHYKVSPRTVRNNAAYAEQVHTLADLTGQTPAQVVQSTEGMGHASSTVPRLIRKASFMAQ
jgi:hypothetical protein